MSKSKIEVAQAAIENAVASLLFARQALEDLTKEIARDAANGQCLHPPVARIEIGTYTGKQWVCSACGESGTA